ncbi:MAG: hypothetical protein RLZZ218_794 [Actinomycetota bacterium]
MADPVSVNKYAELVGLGSDTTMDVMDGISLALGDVSPTDSRLKLASYKAIGSADVVVSADGIAIPRATVQVQVAMLFVLPSVRSTQVQ